MNESYLAGDHGLPPLGHVTWLYLLFYSPYNILGRMVDQYAMTLSCYMTMTSQPLAHVTVIFGFISTFIRPVITKFGSVYLIINYGSVECGSRKPEGISQRVIFTLEI